MTLYQCLSIPHPHSLPKDAISDTGMVLAAFVGKQIPLCLDVERAIRQHNGRAVLTSRHNLFKRTWVHMHIDTCLLADSVCAATQPPRRVA